MKPAASARCGSESAARATWLALALALAGCPAPQPPARDGGDLSDAAADAPPDEGVPADARIVGVTTRTWTDTSRGTAANGDAGARPSRTLVTEVWYPALGAPAAPTIETRDAPPDPSGAPYPLVLFVHGSSGTRRQSVFLTRALAAAGYVVAAADFPLTALSTPGGPSDLHVDAELGDLGFLADQLAAAGAMPGDAVLSRLPDASHYVVAGHSTGGTVALLAAYAPDQHDARVAGVAAMAPCACFFADSFFATRDLPLLVMGGTRDLFVPFTTNGARAYALARTSVRRDLVALLGGTHLYFTDLRVPDDAVPGSPTTTHDDIAVALAAYGGGTACEPVPPLPDDPPMSFDAQHRHAIEWVRAFADATLRASPAGLVALRARGDSDVRVMSAP